MKNKVLYYCFADFICQIEAPKIQSDYVEKCYKKSPFASFISKTLIKGQKVDFKLQVEIVDEDKKIDLFRLVDLGENVFKLECSDNLFFLFPIIEQILRKIYYVLFFKNDGFVLHSSGVTHKNKASIFVGNSGAGKSTIVRILGKSKYFTPFADNNIFVRYDRQKKDFLIYKSPFLEWNVVYKENVSDKDLMVSIENIFILKKSKSNSIRKVSFNEAVKSVAQQVQIPLRNLSDGEINNSRKLIFLFLKTQQRNMRELSFKNDKSISEYILSMVKN